MKYVREFMLAGGILAGASGLVIAGATKAQVEALEKRTPAIETRLMALEREVSALKASVDAHHEWIKKALEKDGGE